MDDVGTPLTAKAKLALSRGQLLAAMGFEELRTEAGDTIRRIERATEARTGLTARIEDKVSQSVIGHWWHRNALRGYLELARPFVESYARRNPGKLIAYGAGTGALLWVIKPWRLISATTIITLMLTNADIVGLLSGAVKKVRALQDTGE